MKINKMVDRYTPFIEATLAEILTLHSCETEPGRSSYERGGPLYLSTVETHDEQFIPRGRKDRVNPAYRHLAFPYVMLTDEVDQVIAGNSIFACADWDYPRNSPADIGLAITKRNDGTLVLRAQFQQIIGSIALAVVDPAELRDLIERAEALANPVKEA